MSLSDCYRDILLGKDEPVEMWLTGKTAIIYQQELGVPPVDAKGDAINPDLRYYLSKETGLVPWDSLVDEVIKERFKHRGKEG